MLDRSKANDMNIMVLKRIDSQIEEILTTAGHVCLYRMSVDDQQWQRKNIEGSLFLIKRRTQPRFQMLVLNKLSTDNYTEPIHGGLELESNPPYLMYTHGNDEIHGIWFFEETDLHRVSGLLNKILAQLPKPDSGLPFMQHHEAVPAVQELQPAASASAAESGAAGGSGDGFWDRSVHVTESTLQSNQQLVPNNNLLDPNSAPAGSGGLQGLLKAAQQKHTTSQRGPTTTSISPVPVPNSTSMPAEPTPAGAAALLTPAFFEQQQQRQMQAASNVSTPPAAQEPVATTPPAGAANGPGQGANPLQQLLSRASKSTPVPTASSSGGPRGQPQPPIGALSPEMVHDKVKTALIRLANNEAFVNLLAQELRTVGLLQ